MKKFLFITALTPARLLNLLRKDLFLLFLSSLERQTYENWEALLIGEEGKKNGKFTFLKTNSVSKEDKLLFMAGRKIGACDT